MTLTLTLTRRAKDSMVQGLALSIMALGKVDVQILYMASFRQATWMQKLKKDTGWYRQDKSTRLQCQSLSILNVSQSKKTTQTSPCGALQPLCWHFHPYAQERNIAGTVVVAHRRYRSSSTEELNQKLVIIKYFFHCHWLILTNHASKRRGETWTGQSMIHTTSHHATVPCPDRQHPHFVPLSWNQLRMMENKWHDGPKQSLKCLESAMNHHHQLTDWLNYPSLYHPVNSA